MTRLLLTYMKPYKNFLYLYEVVVTMTYKFGGMGQALITLYWQRFTVNMRKISHGVFEMIETCVPSLN